MSPTHPEVGGARLWSGSLLFGPFREGNPGGQASLLAGSLSCGLTFISPVQPSETYGNALCPSSSK